MGVKAGRAGQERLMLEYNLKNGQIQTPSSGEQHEQRRFYCAGKVKRDQRHRDDSSHPSDLETKIDVSRVEISEVKGRELHYMCRRNKTRSHDHQ